MAKKRSHRGAGRNQSTSSAPDESQEIVRETPTDSYQVHSQKSDEFTTNAAETIIKVSEKTSRQKAAVHEVNSAKTIKGWPKTAQQSAVVDDANYLQTNNDIREIPRKRSQLHYPSTLPTNDDTQTIAQHLTINFGMNCLPHNEVGAETSQHSSEVEEVTSSRPDDDAIAGVNESEIIELLSWWRKAWLFFKESGLYSYKGLSYILATVVGVLLCVCIYLVYRGGSSQSPDQHVINICLPAVSHTANLEPKTCDWATGNPRTPDESRTSEYAEPVVSTKQTGHQHKPHESRASEHAEPARSYPEPRTPRTSKTTPPVPSACCSAYRSYSDKCPVCGFPPCVSYPVPDDQ